MRMVWQDMSPFPIPRMDAEEEREMRLAAQARAGADWALAALIARYQPPVLRYLTRLTGNATQSLSLAEQIFVRMERRLRGPHGAEHLRLWLLRAATESGLDVLRHPRRSRQQTRLHAPEGPSGLLMDGQPGAASDRLRAGLNKIAEITGSTRRQVRQLIWNNDEQAAPDDAPQSAKADIPPPVDPEIDTMTPHEELRHRLIRAVLAELPYGDAQCLALHLVAGLNQTEVAQALGIRPSAARHRIVQGLQMFALRYEAAVTSLGVPNEIAYADNAESLLEPATAGTVADTVIDAMDARDQSYSTSAAESSGMGDSSYAASVAGDPANDAAMATETASFEEVFPEGYRDEYDLVETIAAPDVSRPAPAPMIVDALPVTPPGDVKDHQMGDMAAIKDELDDYWSEQPTTVPVLSLGAPPAAAEEPAEPGASDVAAVADTELTATEMAARSMPETAPRVPVLTPPNQHIIGDFSGNFG